MSFVIPIFVFVFGAIIGSFLNVVVLRINTGESIARGRSRCLSCSKELTWYENIPLLSFIFQRGKCLNCESKISWQYPLVEVVIGLLALFVYFKITGKVFSLVGEWFLFFSAFASLFLLAFYDLRTKIIEPIFLYIFSGFAVFAAALRWNTSMELWPIIFRDIGSSFLVALFFYLLWKVSGGRWMGRGDADIAMAVSLFLGYPLNFIMLVISFWMGGVVGLILLTLKSARFTLKSEVPFAPFLALGTLVAWYWSPGINEFMRFFTLN